jgi:hypothetical protein
MPAASLLQGGHGERNSAVVAARDASPSLSGAGRGEGRLQTRLLVVGGDAGVADQVFRPGDGRRTL